MLGFLQGRPSLRVRCCRSSRVAGGRHRPRFAYVAPAVPDRTRCYAFVQGGHLDAAERARTRIWLSPTQRRVPLFIAFLDVHDRLQRLASIRLHRARGELQEVRLCTASGYAMDERVAWMRRCPRLR